MTDSRTVTKHSPASIADRLAHVAALGYLADMTRLRADLILLLVAAIWGLAFVFQKTAMTTLGPYTFVASRSLVAAVALAPLAFLESRRATVAAPSSFVSLIAISGLLFFIAAAFQQVGLKTATVTNAGFLTALYVVFTPFVAWAWHKKSPNRVVWPAAVLSFVGTWFLGGGAFSAFNQGDILIAICAVFWATHVVSTSYATKHNRPLTFTCLQFAIVAVLAMIAAAWLETPTWAALQSTAGEIAYVGILSSALTFTLFAVAMKHTPPSEAAVIISTECLFGALAGAILLGERLGWISWLGAGLIVASVILVQLAPAWEEQRAKARATAST